MNKLEKNSAIPLYYQLYSLILQQIQNGTLKPGDMLPPETSMMETYDVSRATVRHAVLDLAREGYLVRIKSKGTIVKDRDVSFGYHPERSFSALSDALGAVELKNKVLEACVTDPSEEVKEALRLGAGDKVFYLKRVRSIGDTPSVYVEDWIDYKQCKGIDCIDFNRATLFKTLKEIFGLNLSKMQRTFETCYPCNEEQMREMDIRKDTSLLKCTNIVFVSSDTPLVFSIARINGKYTVSE